jgi:hypothetical protein
MPKKINYSQMLPVGKCKVCGINLWAEHNNGPAPHTYPCLIEGCAHPSSAQIIAFPRSMTGNAIALIEG